MDANAQYLTSEALNLALQSSAIV